MTVFPLKMNAHTGSARMRMVATSPVFGTTVGVFGVILVWYGAAQLHRLIPSPGEALTSVTRSVSTGLLQGHAAWTFSNTIQGFAIAALVGISAGLFIGLNPRIRSVLGDMVYAMSSVPKLVVFPILLVLFGLGRIPETLFVALSGVFLITIQVMTGCGEIQAIHRRVGRVFRASPAQVLFSILLPAVAPSMIAGLRLGFSMGLVHAVLAEMALGNDGIGFMIWAAYRNLDMGLLFGLVFIVSIVAIAINLALYYVEKKLRGGATVLA